MKIARIFACYFFILMRLEDEIKQKQFKHDYQKAAINILFTYHWLQNFYSDVIKKHGITTQQFNLLRILRGQYPNPASVKLLRERMIDKMSDASRLVEKLRQKDLVQRTTSEQDRRNVDVLITDNGLKLLMELDEIDHLSKQQLSGLNEDEIKQLNFLLDKLRG